MSTKEAVKQSNKIIKNVGKIALRIKRDSKRIQSKAIDKALDLNGAKTPFKASSLVKSQIDSDLRKIINDTNKDFKAFTKAIEIYLADNFTIKLSEKDIKVIAQKGSLLLDNLVINTDILKNDIQRLLTQNLAKGIPQKRLVLELQELYPAYSRNASSIINTGLSRLFIDTNIAKLENSRFEWFIWAGPDDSITREDPCKHWVWHRFSKSQLATITATRMTLWNCRHSIIPISNDEIEEYPVGNIDLA